MSMERLVYWFERLVYWNEYQTESDYKNTTSQFRYFFESNFVGVNRFLVLNYTNEANNAKRFYARKYLPKMYNQNL